MNVWTYWEGPRVPYIESCLDSVRRHCYRDCCFHHVTSDNIEEYIPDGILDPYWKKITQLGVKSDCVRAACLYLYGGLYVDADTVMLRSPVGVIDESADCAYMTWTNPPRRAIAGYIYCRPGSPVAKKWLDNMNKKLSQQNAGWTELGEGSLTPAIDSCDSSKMQVLPLSTFLPIEIDREVERFFRTENWRHFVSEKTIAFGLNHSWMTARRAGDMQRWNSGSRLLVHQILKEAISASNYEPRVAVCTITYKRPKLLGHLIDCFQKQTYKNKFMIALDDSGEVSPAKFDNCEVISVSERFDSLGTKRNAVAAAAKDSDIICMWDDDDLYLPDAIESIVRSSKSGDWIRPSRVLARLPNGNLSQSLTHCDTDKTDKGFHVAWGMSRGAFDAVEGYPDGVSLGEDLGLAKRLRDIGVSECDPIELGRSPYYISSPYQNEHFSWSHKDYATWPDKVKIDGPSEVVPCPPPFVIGEIEGKIHRRSWQNNWWDCEARP